MEIFDVDRVQRLQHLRIPNTFDSRILDLFLNIEFRLFLTNRRPITISKSFPQEQG